MHACFPAVFLSSHAYFSCYNKEKKSKAGTNQNLLVGWFVGFWCTHFLDLPPLINSFLVILAPLINSVPVSSAKVKTFYEIDN